MNLSNLIDRLNNELDKLNKLKSDDIDTRSFFTDNEHFNDDFPINYSNTTENVSEKSDQSENIQNTDTNPLINTSQNIEPDNETKSLVVVKPNYLITAQTMFKRTIRFSLKSFLISISLSFLNLFV